MSGGPDIHQHQLSALKTWRPDMNKALYAPGPVNYMKVNIQSSSRIRQLWKVAHKQIWTFVLRDGQKRLVSHGRQGIMPHVQKSSFPMEGAWWQPYKQMDCRRQILLRQFNQLYLPMLLECHSLLSLKFISLPSTCCNLSKFSVMFSHLLCSFILHRFLSCFFYSV